MSFEIRRVPKVDSRGAVLHTEKSGKESQSLPSGQATVIKTNENAI